MRTSGGLSDVEHDDDRPLQAFGAEIVLEEAAHLAAALADQRDHGDVGGGAARHHAEQRALADAAAAEQADALAAAAGQQRVDGADAGAQRRDDRLARPADSAAADERRRSPVAQRPEAVERPAERRRPRARAAPAPTGTGARRRARR